MAGCEQAWVVRNLRVAAKINSRVILAAGGVIAEFVLNRTLRAQGTVARLD
jgi:hypothetical protein